MLLRRPRLTPDRDTVSETIPLPDHLYNRGLISGRHSDITVHAFDYPYRLHRLILDRAPFFASALSGAWLESNAKEISLHPEDIDGNITQVSFELALKRLYGAGNPNEEAAEAIGLFATGCWLEMPDLIDSSIAAILRQMSVENVAPLIKLVTGNYYGRAGDKILESAKAMLCRDGWKMRLSFWDGIPGDIVREIVGGDGLFIDGEWDRWVLAKRILNRRLKQAALEAGLTDDRNKNKVLKAPDATNLMAVRFDTVYRKNAMTNAGGMPDNLHRWIMLYTNIDVEPLLVLLDEGIHYVHLPFEQLQYIRRARDVLGLPMLPDRIISNALWMQMELRQKVLNAHESDMELGLSQAAEESASFHDNSLNAILAATSPRASKGKGRMRDASPDTGDEELASDSWDGNGKPRKFWIPSSDCNMVMGGNADPVMTASPANHAQTQASRLSATIQPEDVQWASDFAAVTSDTRPQQPVGRPGSTVGSLSSNEARPVAYSCFPPFRFAAEFPNPRVLKEKKRVYSQTVFYLGSFWNVYVQRVRRGKNPQLGVYLHRAKEREAVEAMDGGAAAGNVDERIGHLEREMRFRADNRQRVRGLGRQRGGEAEIEGDGGDSSGSTDRDGAVAGVGEATSSSRNNNNNNTAVRGLLGRKTSQTAEETGMGESPPGIQNQASYVNPADNEDEEEGEDPELIRLTRNLRVATLPPYVDARPTIRTYFKIYSPSKGGRMLSVYESAPDTFNFSQSWGWKSSTLMLDDGTLPSDDGGDDGDGLPASLIEGSGIRKDGKLRFMIVIGNV